MLCNFNLHNKFFLTFLGHFRRRSDEVSDLDSDLDDALSEASWNSEDDPDRLWCICRKPHNNRFMICCDVCEEWFHGKCVGITKTIGDVFFLSYLLEVVFKVEY